MAWDIIGFAPQAQGDHWDRMEDVLDRDRLDALSTSGGFFPVVRGELCAFVFAGNYDLGMAGSVFDEGSARISQALSTGDGCSRREFLTVADCETEEFVILHGDGGPHNESGIAGFHENLIGHHLYPEGPIHIAAATSVSELAGQAEANGLRVTRADELAAFENRYFGGDEVRPLCGCEIYHSELRAG